MNSSWMGIGFEVVRSAGETTLYSRRQNVLNQKFHYIATVLKNLPDDTVVDGELVALAPDGGPDFNLLQNFGSAESRLSTMPSTSLSPDPLETQHHRASALGTPIDRRRGSSDFLSRHRPRDEGR